MNILYQIPFPHAIYAGRTIYMGFKHAFEDLGHTFRPLTANDRAEQVFAEFQPDLCITGLTSYALRYLNPELLRREKRRGMKVFVNIPFWRSPLSKLRFNESRGLAKNPNYLRLIRSGDYGDMYYNVCEADDPRMEGFTAGTGYPHHTVLLAADKLLHFPEYDPRFAADLCYVGTYLPEKQSFFRTQVFPLRKRYSLRLYGQDWTLIDRWKGFAQKVGQYFNIPGLRSLQRPKLALEDERRIYSSTTISLNVHEEYQKQFGGDCNERTFKIPACGGFEITDDVACIRRYFRAGEEMVIARNRDDWFEKIAYYLKNPDKRLPIIEAGRKKVLEHHTYHNRVQQLLCIYHTL